MTDNTQRPEPMSRESVLAVLDEATSFKGAVPTQLRAAIAAVSALYERCEALERDIRYLTAIADAATSGTEPSDAEGGG
jgi:hypothetical protein